MGMAFWAHIGVPNKHKTKQSDSKNFINKVRNNPVLNKRGENAKKQSVRFNINSCILLMHTFRNNNSYIC
jgi:hypothetical protein